MSWIKVGIKGTAQVVEFKTVLKGVRQKNTLAMKNLSRQIGIFKECINGYDEQKCDFREFVDIWDIFFNPIYEDKLCF